MYLNLNLMQIIKTCYVLYQPDADYYEWQC